MKDYVLECCVDSLEAAQAAQEGGATRLELCANLVIGGTTPSPALYQIVREAVSLPLHVMIRPRFGDFCYSGSELRIMREEVAQFRALGADGVVFGALRPDGVLDAHHMRELCACAGELRVTLHRAFDVAADPLETLARAQELGVHTILTSGQRPTALEGAPLIARLVAACAGVEILAGGGVSAAAIPRLRESTGARAYHLSAKSLEEGPMVYRRPDIHMGLPGFSEYERWRCSREQVAAARSVLEQID